MKSGTSIDIKMPKVSYVSNSLIYQQYWLNLMYSAHY